MELRESIGSVLRPFYDLRRSMGEADFDKLFELIDRALEDTDEEEVGR
ncbi:MAG: hypothetical protein SOU51_01430 [Collinsella sp.]|nr:hypothetical protein [Collinsella sp.]